MIIMVTSGYALLPATRAPTYSATKAGLHSFTMALRRQLQGVGIRVVEGLPPLVDTPATRSVRQRKILPETLVGRVWRDIERGRDEILPGKVGLLPLLMRLAHRTLHAVLQGHDETLFGSRRGPNEGSRSFRRCCSRASGPIKGTRRGRTRALHIGAVTSDAAPTRLSAPSYLQSIATRRCRQEHRPMLALPIADCDPADRPYTRMRKQKSSIASMPCTKRSGVTTSWHMPTPSAAPTRAHRE